MTGITLFAFRVFVISAILFVIFGRGYYVGYHEAIKDIKVTLNNRMKERQKQK